MNLIKTFIDLTSHVVPHGSEGEVAKMVYDYINSSKHKANKDGFGNIFCIIGKSKTLFTCHLDTVGHKHEKINHIVTNEYVKTDGTTILGGDNKAGVTILLNMIFNNIPGTYYFFLGEEVGCLGSRWLLSQYSNELKKFNRAIAFDRREKGSIITYQRSTRSASSEFAISLAKEFEKCNLLFKEDQNGIFTDTAVFTKVIPECTNISAGVYGEHTNQERLDINYFLSICDATLKIDWENLVTKRNPNVTEHKRYNTNYLYNQNQIGYNRSYNSTRNTSHDLYEEEEEEEYTISSYKKLSDSELLKAYNEYFNKNSTILTRKEKIMIQQQYESVREEFLFLEGVMEEFDYYTETDFKPNIHLIFTSTKKENKGITIYAKVKWNETIYLGGAGGVLKRMASSKDMKEAITNIINRKFILKKPIYNGDNQEEIYNYFNADYNAKKEDLIFYTNDVNIRFTDFISKYGGNLDYFQDFINKDGITIDNGLEWPELYILSKQYPDEDIKTLKLIIKNKCYGGTEQDFINFLKMNPMLSHVHYNEKYKLYLDNKSKLSSLLLDDDFKGIIYSCFKGLPKLSYWYKNNIEIPKKIYESMFKLSKLLSYLKPFELCNFLNDILQKTNLDIEIFVEMMDDFKGDSITFSKKPLIDRIVEFNTVKRVKKNSLNDAINEVKKRMLSFSNDEAEKFIMVQSNRLGITQKELIAFINSNITWNTSMELCDAYNKYRNML